MIEDDAQMYEHEYAVADFSETVQALPWEPVRVLAAYGVQGEDSEWHGGFAVESADGRTSVVVGWCDRTGWGCQDDATLICDLGPDDEGSWESAVNARSDGNDEVPHTDGWERDPADLNKWIADGMQDEYALGGSTDTPAWRNRPEYDASEGRA